jgi:hypothetical protein
MSASVWDGAVTAFVSISLVFPGMRTLEEDFTHASA